MSEITFRTSVGACTVDPSKLRPEDLARLRGASGPNGDVDYDVLVKIINKYPDAFHYIPGSNGLPNPDGPFEDADFKSMEENLDAVIARALRACAKANQDTAKTAMDMAMTESAAIMVEANEQKQKALDAVEQSRQAGMATAGGQMAGGVLQGGASLKAATNLKGAAKSTGRMNDANESLPALQNDRSRIQTDLDDLKFDRKTYPALSGELTPRIRVKQHEAEGLDTRIAAAKNESARSQATADQGTRSAQNNTQVGTIVNQLSNGFAKMAEAELSAKAGLLSAEGKFDEAQQNQANMKYQAVTEAAHMARDAMNEARGIQKELAASSQAARNAAARF
jgi:hypothetical protein